MQRTCCNRFQVAEPLIWEKEFNLKKLDTVTF